VPNKCGNNEENDGRAVHWKSLQRWQHEKQSNAARKVQHLQQLSQYIANPAVAAAAHVQLRHFQQATQATAAAIECKLHKIPIAATNTGSSNNKTELRP